MTETVTHSHHADPTAWTPGRQLPLPHRLFLVAHDYIVRRDSEARPLVHLPALGIGLAGAALIQLGISRRIYIRDGYVVAATAQPIGDPFCDSVLGHIVASLSPRLVGTWVQWLSGSTYDWIRNQLVDMGVLQAVVHRRMFSTRTVYVLPDTTPYVQTRGAISYAVLGRGHDEECGALCALVTILRLESALYMAMRSAEVRDRLTHIRRRAEPETIVVADVVETLIGDKSVAVYG